MTDKTDRDGLAKVAFDEAVRTLQHQDSEVNDIRSRVLTIVSISGVSTAIAAGSSLASEKGGALAYTLAGLATVALIALLYQVWLVLRPIETFIVEVDAAEIVDQYLDDPTITVGDSYRDLALHYARYQSSNHDKIMPLRAALTRVQIGATVQVLLWVALAWIGIT